MTASVFTPRQGRPELGGPYEGVPEHLRQSLTRWLEQSHTQPEFEILDLGSLERLAALLRIDLHGNTGHAVFREILDWAGTNDDRCLDLLHYTLKLPPVDVKEWRHLEMLLHLGGSVWRATEDGLERRVDPTAMEAFNAVTATEDAASDQLALAWTSAYGRNSDPSDAWNHAIKAVEAVLIPLVVPGQDGAHVGHVLGQLDRQGQHWNTILKFNQPAPPVNPPFNSVQTLVGMLRLLYPNPDRHVGPDHRTPSLEEARAVVQLAVTIVQWTRDGQIVRR